MTRHVLLLFLIFTTSMTFGQNCGFDVNEIDDVWIRKMEWFVQQLSNQELVISKDKKDIPEHIKKQLDCEFNGFDIANPEEEHQRGCSVEDGLPSRHLSFIAMNENILIIRYFTYNLGSSGHNIWIKYDNSGIADFWSGSTLAGNLNDTNFNITNYLKNVTEESRGMYHYIKKR